MRPPITTEIVNVTPLIATEWLHSNPRNRHIRRTAVEAMARDMRAGRWLLTGDTIKFDGYGNLLDGQHRLTAVVVAGVPITFLVVRDLPSEIQLVIDSGTTRTGADMLTMRGVRYGPQVASIARLGVLHDLGQLRAGSKGAVKLTHAELDAWITYNPDVAQAAEAAVRYRSIERVSVIGYCWLQLNRVDPGDCKDFFESLAHNATDGLGDPRAALLSRLTNARLNRESLVAATVVSLVFRAWNAWRNGETMRTLVTVARSGPVPIPRPI